MLKQAIAAFAVGGLFAIGLTVSGMTQPGKVVGFLDFFGGAWDPALTMVMVGGIATYAVSIRLITKRKAPVFAEVFRLPTAKRVTPKLIGGAALFGIGWGMAGFCPGPGITSLGTASTSVFVFMASMAGGMAMWLLIDKALTARRALTAKAETAAPFAASNALGEAPVVEPANAQDSESYAPRQTG